MRDDGEMTALATGVKCARGGNGVSFELVLGNMAESPLREWLGPRRAEATNAAAPVVKNPRNELLGVRIRWTTPVGWTREQWYSRSLLDRHPLVLPGF